MKITEDAGGGEREVGEGEEGRKGVRGERRTGAGESKKIAIEEYRIMAPCLPQ